MALRQKAEEYFSSINSMAKRMCVDMRETKLSYEDLWQTLTFEEQQQILNQSIIKPEVSLKYPAEEPRDQARQYAVKMIVDDNYTYRDEHSAPFTFRTSSQRDLTLATSPKKTAIIKAAPPKAVIQIIPVKKEIVVQPVVDDDDDDEDDEGDADSLTHILPKTGLDLLDNW